MNLLRINKKGISIVEVLVIAGIMSVMMMSILSMITNQQNEAKFLEQKISTLDLQKILKSSFHDGSVCNSILSSPSIMTFDSTLIGSATPPEFAISSIPASSLVGAPSLIATTAIPNTTLIASSIKVTDIQPTVVSDSWKAHLKIDFAPDSLIRNLKPISVDIKFKTSSLSPLSAKIFTSCSGAGPWQTLVVKGPIICRSPVSVATCPAGYTLIGGGHEFLGDCACSEVFRMSVVNRPSDDGKSWIEWMECSLHRAYALCKSE